MVFPPAAWAYALSVNELSVSELALVDSVCWHSAVDCPAVEVDANSLALPRIHEPTGTVILAELVLYQVLDVGVPCVPEVFSTTSTNQRPSCFGKAYCTAPVPRSTALTEVGIAQPSGT